jgi:hypothetical protein
MSLAALELSSASGAAEASAALPVPRLSGLVLVRLAAAREGLAENELARELQPVVAEALDAREWQRKLSEIIANLTAAKLVTAVDRRLEVTANGKAAATQVLGLKKFSAGAWPEVRDGPLIAVALGLEKEPPSRLKGLRKLDGLRSLIVLSAFKLKVRGQPSPSRLRAALAVLALERAFGGQIKHGLGEKPGLSAKSGRLLAGQLAAKPKDFGADARLVAALAAEAVGAPRSDLAPLRLAVLRRFVGVTGAQKPAASAKQRKSKPPPKPVLTVAETRPHADVPRASEPHTPAIRARAPVRPDPAGFAREVLAAARIKADGWSGNRKALISRVWETLRADRPEWSLTEIEFKCMLIEAHRCGLLVLANADLKDKRDLKVLQESAVSYKNTIWHFIRVED